MAISEKPKVLFVLHLPPPVHGAATVGKTIFESDYIKSHYQCRFINLATAASLEDIGHFRFHKLSDFLHLKRKIKEAVIEFQPDLIYLTPSAVGLAFFKDFFIVQMLKRMGKKVLLHFHNKGVKQHQDNFIYDFCYKRFFKNVKVMLLSSYLYPDMERYLKENQYSVCFNGIPVKETKQIERDTSSKEPVNIMFLSNLLIAKGIYVLIDACKILKDRNIPFTCTVIGAETNEISADILNDYIRENGLNNQIKYVGKAYGEEKDAYFDKTDIFAFPTFNEALPLVLIEAMQHGVPIISAPEGGIQDILIDGKNGLMCKTRDSASLASALQRLIENPELRKEMGTCGKEIYLQKFTLEHFEQQFVRIINSSLN